MTSINEQHSEPRTDPRAPTAPEPAQEEILYVFVRPRQSRELLGRVYRRIRAKEEDPTRLQVAAPGFRRLVCFSRKWRLAIDKRRAFLTQTRFLELLQKSRTTRYL